MGWLGLAVAVMVSGGLACGEAQAPAERSASPTASAQPASAPAAKPRRRGRPLPAFQGFDLDGQRVDFADLLGRRSLIFLFDPAAADAALVASAVAAVAPDAAQNNFRVLGVAHGTNAATARSFVERHGLEAPVVDDPARRVAGLLGLSAPVGLVLVDAEGQLARGTQMFSSEASDPSALVESELRGWLRLAERGAGAAPTLGERPPAPDFTAPRMDGGEPFQLSAKRGQPLALIFFLHTCPHCHSALRAFRVSAERIPEDERPELVGISLVDRPAEVRQSLAAEDLDFFPVLLDPDRRIRAAYAAEMSVPVLFLIDAEGRIVSRNDGWRDDRDPPLLRMRLARLAGAKPPMLLHRSGYSGDEFCGVCHQSQHDTWQLTPHASAFETLVRHGEDQNEECIGCHVVGFNQPGGYVADGTTRHFEDVSCESCHGRGGPHLSPNFMTDGNYEPICVGCHDTKHSLGFDYASFVPRVSHAVNARFAGLSLDEKRKLLAEQRRSRKNPLPTGAAFVGSAACRGCHAKEYETWASQPHARALASLDAKGEAGNAECLACHTTGYARTGGFPAGASGDAHPALAGVGCESCHGPGGEHVKPDAPRRGSIVSLTDKCDSCVILQICGSCHDDANDPGFEFEVQDKIERQRHGTIAPGGETVSREFHRGLLALEARRRARGEEG